MISLVTKFKINVPDLAGLMILPDILTVIQEKLLDDQRQLTDLNLRPKVVLNNASSEIFLEDNFDQFELAKKFNQFSRYSQDFKLFSIKNTMHFLSDEGRIIQYNFLAALENLIIDRSIIPNYFGERIEPSNMTLDIIDLMFKRSEYLYIGSDTYSIVPLSRRSVYNNVKKLLIDDDISYKGGIKQFLMQFPQVEILEVGQLIIDIQKNFFARFENVLKSNMLKHLKHFKISMMDFNDCVLKSRKNLDYLFQIIVDIEGPTLELEIKFSCMAAGFLDPNLDPTFYSIFDNYKVQKNYKNFDPSKKISNNEKCKMKLVCNKNPENEHKYTFEITYKKKISKTNLGFQMYL
eukprot:403369755